MRNQLTTSCVLVCLLSAVLFVLGNRDSDEIKGDEPVHAIRTNSLQLINDQGRMVARIEPMPEGYPGIGVAFGENQLAVFSILVTPDGSAQVGIGSDKGQSSIGLYARSDGSVRVSFDALDGKHSEVLGQSSEAVTFVSVDEVRTKKN